MTESTAKPPAFQALCKQRQIVEGEMTPFDVNGIEVIVLWPQGGVPKAFQATCPHQDVALKDGYFNGQILTCPAHEWVFDGHTGEGVSPTGCALREYPTRIADGVIEIDAAAVDPF